MVLATADGAGAPWATPVWFATEDGRKPLLGLVTRDATLAKPCRAASRSESRSSTRRKRRVPAKACTSLRVAAQVAPDELDAGIAIFTAAGLAVGLSAWSVDDVQAPAKHRLYRATAVERFVLDDHDERVAVP